MTDTGNQGNIEGDTVDNNGIIALDTPEQISAWVFLSRMHQLALELNTGLKHSRGPILKAMFMEGLIDADLKGTKKNKKMVLGLMVDTYKEIMPEWEPSPSVIRALGRE